MLGDGAVTMTMTLPKASMSSEMQLLRSLCHSNMVVIERVTEECLLHLIWKVYNFLWSGQLKVIGKMVQ